MGTPLEVLIIDDEPGLARALGRMLREHRVTEATSAEDALTLFEQQKVFDTIVCDLNLPKRSGAELHAELSLARPALAQRMIFTTGGALSEESRDFLDRLEPWRVLEKPITPQQLRDAVQRAAAQAFRAP